MTADTTTAADASGTLSKIKPQPSYPANPTLYLSNIDWSIKKTLLKRSLLALFTRHGKVLDVICLRGDATGGRSLRGQAWVIFESQSAATAALEAERGFVFFGRPLMVNYAKDVSDRIAKRNGTYSKKTKDIREKRKLEGDGGGGGDAKMARVDGSGVNATTVNDPSSLVKKKEDVSAPTPSPKTGEITASTTPSSLILAQNLPSECSDMMLQMLFQQHAGYKGLKLVKAGMATIEFDSESQATVALKGLNGFKLTPSATLDLTYVAR
ncbi:predicted protein [Thalassiosira pseudonana CCMP1335]|jgi:U2 small nuclear ribonucleoprotein B''|uniref:RRM domain-containing protein n=1 Tax=Thalassiosira pseudonana TaxID=35128 RepID=B8BS34_THAPS|nr:predicted protein [Thalassiosira pseudonana CCMP1335]EED96652.1 predicted protein [Thalassiosira pseudonana CCMP1335]|eukprot:g1505.t1 g1505   contig10:2234037-2234840(-)